MGDSCVGSPLSAPQSRGPAMREAVYLRGLGDAGSGAAYSCHSDAGGGRTVPGAVLLGPVRGQGERTGEESGKGIHRFIHGPEQAWAIRCGAGVPAAKENWSADIRHFHGHAIPKGVAQQGTMGELSARNTGCDGCGGRAMTLTLSSHHRLRARPLAAVRQRLGCGLVPPQASETGEVS